MTLGTSLTLALLAGATVLGAEEAPTLRASLDAGRAKLASELGGIQVSAFGDALDGYGASGRRSLTFGSGEVDAAGDLTQDLQLGLAGVTNRTATRLTVGFLDYHPFGGGLAPRGQIGAEKGFHVQVGRFDVPYGGDWPYYASKDSVSISRPLTTTGIMDGGYNDAGVRVLGNNGTLNFNAFLLRGFLPGRLLGGRVGLTPFSDPFSLKGTRDPKAAEVGLSWFYDGTSRWEKREAGCALDADGHLGAYTLRGEYLSRTREAAAEGGRLARHGWQITQEYGLQDLLPWPTTLFARTERVTVAAGATPPGRDARVAAGLSLSCLGILLVKLEGQHVLEASSATLAAGGFHRNAWYAQLVAVF